MKLNVLQALRDPGAAYAFQAEQAIAPQDVNGEPIAFDPAHLEGVVSATEDGTVTLSGVLTTTAHAHCAKCLSPASAVISAPFRETFLHGEAREDDDHFAYEGSAVDLERLALTAALLELPMRFLCREDCPGMETWAGQDVFTRSSQEELAGQRPFAALRQLLAEKSDEQE